MDDSALDNLFSGDLDKLIQLPKRLVRLFISSTFTDMMLERNSLMERVYPRLKKYCRERHGLDFQVVDMRWGVRDEATDDHQTANLCSREIDNCQRMSLGPSFVALLGDKYGFRPLCNKIKSAEYRALRRCLIELDTSTDLLDSWYKEDLNAVPAEYLLQPISSILKNFTNRNEPELQALDQRQWQAIQARLHELLMIGSSRLVKQGRMSEQEQLMKYSISVTEREVIEGCLDVNEAKSSCLVYVRSIGNLRHHLARCLEGLDELKRQGDTGAGEVRTSIKIGDEAISAPQQSSQASSSERKLERSRRLIGKYIDLSCAPNDSWRVDDEAQELLANLRGPRLEAKLSVGRSLTKFEVEWDELEGLSLKVDEHRHYLAELTEHFYANITRMIRRAARNEQAIKSGLVGELLQHSHYARHVTRSFHGRSEELEKIRAYILSRTDGEGVTGAPMPMLVYGVGGSGKTSVLARAATLAKDWIRRSRRRAQGGARKTNKGSGESWDQRPCIIMRFCCTTPTSSTTVGVLTSVCRQLQFNFYQFGPLNAALSKGGQRRDLEEGGGGGGGREQLSYEPIPEDFVRLVFKFRQLLDNCQHPLHRQRLFLIILDSVERLGGPSDGGGPEARFAWLTGIARLPPNVRLIVSCGSESGPAAGESWAEDYRHLKRHFLRLYLGRRRSSDASNHEDEDEAAAAAAAAALEADADAEEPSDGLQSARSSMAAAEGVGGLAGPVADPSTLGLTTRINWVKRLMIPAVRIRRGSQAVAGVGPSRTSSASSLAEEANPAAQTTAPRPRLSSQTRSRTPSLSPSSSLAPEVGEAKRPAANRGRRRKQDAGGRVWLVHVRPMGVELALQVLQCWLAEQGRILSQQQWAIVRKSMLACSRPIFVKLAFGEIVHWKSYSAQSDSANGLTFGSALLENNHQLLARVERDDPVLMNLLAHCQQQQQQPKPATNELAADSKKNGSQLRMQILSMEQQWLNYLDNRQRQGGDTAKGGDPVNRPAAKASRQPTSSICHLSNTIEAAICQLFGRIETQHGHLLTKHSLSYITAARNGICENELEDILSLDDVVLDDVFQYHLPPVRRIPPLLWTRIRNDLSDYLSERDADGIVVDWHHSQFKEVTRRRYMADRRQLLYIHSQLADYFLGKWADVPKPFRCTRQQVLMAIEQVESAVQQSMRDSQQQQLSSGAQASVSVGSGRSVAVGSRWRSSGSQQQRLQWCQAKADRRVAHQPLYYEDGENNDSNKRRRYNMRKLSELPFHLMRSGRYQDLADEVLFNYRWLFASLDAMGLQWLLADFEAAARALEASLDETQQGEARRTDGDVTAAVPPPDLRSMLNQLRVLNNTVRLSCSAIHSDTQMLGPQLIGRLLPLLQQPNHNHHYLAKLLHQCDCLAPNDCALLPTGHCLQAPDGLLLSSLEGHSFAITGMAMSLDGRHLLAASNRFIMWDISTGEVSRDVEPKLEGSLVRQMRLGLSNEFVVAFTSANQVLLLDILTQQVAKFAQFMGAEPLLGIELIDRFAATSFLVWSRSSWFKLRLRQDDHKSALMPQRLDIELVYGVGLESVLLSGASVGGANILSVQQVDCTRQEEEEIVCLLVELNDGDKLQLITGHMAHNETRGWHLVGWPQLPIEASALSLDKHQLRQLVFVDPVDGGLYLRRRRRRQWSRPKLIKNLQREASLEKSKADEFSFGSEHETHENRPLAIETDLDESMQHGARLNHHQFNLSELAEFERQIEGPVANDLHEPMDDGFVYELNESKSGTGKGKIGSTNGVQVIRIYMSNRILVVWLVCGKLSEKLTQKCLWFPKNVRNISVEPNQSQMKSLLLEDEQMSYLVASAGHLLLLYDLREETLLKSIDAHAARIVQLVPVLDGGGQLSLASASMDKSVKIWNLSNVNKDVFALDKLSGGPIRSICLASNRPLAACLTRTELGLWDWRTMKLLARISASSLSPIFSTSDETQLNRNGDKLVGCRLSKSGRHLCIASLDAIYMFTLDDFELTATNSLELKRVFEWRLANLVGGDCQAALVVRSLRFHQQDARILVCLEGSLGADETDDSDKSSRTMTTTAAATTTKLFVVALSVPDARHLFTIEVPASSVAAQAMGAEPHHFTTGKRRSSLAPPAADADQERRPLLKLPVLTRDQLHLVTAEACRSPASDAQEPQRRKSSSPANFGQLGVYSVRDGSLVRRLDLGRLQPEEAAARSAAKPGDNKSTQAEVAILNEQFSRLKSVHYRERTTVVALLDELGGGPSHLVDVQTGHLLVRSQLWNGKVSRDGRFGLSKMFKSATLHGHPVEGSFGEATAAAATIGAGQGLQLLEMRRCSPIRSLLQPEALARLAIGSGEPSLQASGGDSDVSCGFAGPDDAHVYYLDRRLKRLLLVRCSGGELVANYRLSSQPANVLRRSSDGLALVLGLADGSLASLAVLDPQLGDTSERLAELPSRRCLARAAHSAGA